ncbi:MAG: hypothetical protein JXA54_07810 [Candidatus Heimdallarchaeota archaeon]|nr:hypothetical protein [Candidatus Heimdallarchaeota archaeon]
MNKKIRRILIFSSSIILVLGIYGLLMFGLKDFNDPLTGAYRIDETGDDSRLEHPFVLDNSTFREIGRAVGFVLWEAKGIDIIIVGIILLVAAEAASTVVKSVEDQCSEFRTEMCDTDKFVILTRKSAEELDKEEAE